MPRPSRTRPVSAAQVRAYARKAQEFADTAAAGMDSQSLIAARRENRRGNPDSPEWTSNGH